jgi:manganese oxidase
MGRNAHALGHSFGNIQSGYRAPAIFPATQPLTPLNPIIPLIVAAVTSAHPVEPNSATPLPARLGEPDRPTISLPLALPNDNRRRGGTMTGSGVFLHLEALTAAWRPDSRVDSLLTIEAFAESGSAPSIPGPLLRAEQGSEVRVRIRNTLPDDLLLHGIHAGTLSDDLLHVPAGSTREVRFRATSAGTFLYWGTTTGSRIEERRARDSQLTGAIVIDPAGAAIDPAERIFVITGVDIDGSLLKRATPEAIRESAINGLAWPDTEHLTYRIGEKVMWRWINATYQSHPIHLHGFHFRTLARGDGRSETEYEEDRIQEVVTELLLPGGTARFEWVPTRAGRWLVHCHMRAHTARWPRRSAVEMAHDAHDPKRHATESMEGLVMGITTIGNSAGDANRGVVAAPPPRHKLLVLEGPATGDGPTPKAYRLGGRHDEDSGTLPVPGPPLLLTRGEAVTIIVENRLSVPTTVHWHGMELESVFDGVAGWGGFPTHRAPLVGPGESFMVTFTPPRAGTYIYHTHMDEMNQVADGLYGAMLVLEPGEVHDPSRDLIFFTGMNVVEGARQAVLNGVVDSSPLELEVGATYRLRLINMQPDFKMYMELRDGEEHIWWEPLGKDGAELLPALRSPQPARLLIGSGETYDFEWTPGRPMDAVLSVYPSLGPLPQREQAIRVR